MSFLDVSLDRPVVRAAETTTGDLGGVGARYILEGSASDGRVALVEHPIGPRGLAAPVHRHSREDEYTFILEGRWGFWLEGEVAYAEPGDLVFKPRHVWHTFWNATDEPARCLEVISPAGFEHFFVELAQMIASGAVDDEGFASLNARYGLEMDFEQVPGIVADHGLVTDESNLGPEAT